MERLNSVMKKMILVMVLLITSVLLANETNQSILGGDLDKSKNYKELRELSRGIENLTINGWHFVLMDYSGFDRNLQTTNLFNKDDKFALISFFVDSESNMKVLDGIYIPTAQMPFRIVKGKKIYKDKSQSEFYSICEHGTHKGRIIAIATPEAKYVKLDCEHKMKKIKKAWLVDEQSGQIKEIPVKGISCLYVAENDCTFN